MNVCLGRAARAEKALKNAEKADRFGWNHSPQLALVSAESIRSQVVCGSKEARNCLARIELHSHNWHMEPSHTSSSSSSGFEDLA